MATIKLKYKPSTVKGNNGTLYFQIIHHRQVRQMYTDLHIRNEEWDATEAAVIIPAAADDDRRKHIMSISESLSSLKEDLAYIVSQLEYRGRAYSAQDVVSAYNSLHVTPGIVSFTRQLIEDMRKIGKRATVKRYDATLNNLLRYTRGREIDWKDISPMFILGFEEYMMKRGICRNSSSFYMRNLRSIVNRASEQGFEVTGNPFKHVYMGVDKTVKRAVTLDVVRRIRDMDLSGRPALDFARNVFMFAFYTRGMSFVDIAFLKKSDLKNGVITYSRRKTRQQISVRIEPETRKIINSFGACDTPYLLPIITDMSAHPERQYENAYYRINRNIKKIGVLLGLRTKLTLYVARHAWASIAHTNNVSLSTISKAMGHDSEKTTIIYLQSLDSSSVDKANSDIIKLMNCSRMKK